jgi:hypothetical protein
MNTYAQLPKEWNENSRPSEAMWADNNNQLHPGSERIYQSGGNVARLDRRKKVTIYLRADNIQGYSSWRTPATFPEPDDTSPYTHDFHAILLRPPGPDTLQVFDTTMPGPPVLIATCSYGPTPDNWTWSGALFTVQIGDWDQVLGWTLNLPAGTQQQDIPSELPQGTYGFGAHMVAG